MLSMLKQIVIDKDAFIGINNGELCDFVKNHILLISDTLLYECATTKNCTPEDLLNLCQILIENGAYFCSCSAHYLLWEAQYNHPYPLFLGDLDVTESIRKRQAKLVDCLKSPKILQDVISSRYDVAKKCFINISMELKGRLESQKPDVAKVIKKEISGDTSCLQGLCDCVDRGINHKMVMALLSKNLIKDKPQLSPSSEWISWQYVRLLNVIVMFYQSLGAKGGFPQNERVEHDFQDMEYVLLLSRADGLLTRDKRLVKPLAKAAFPDKGVFSSLDEVPDSYRFDWR